jgi:hypothetical protein
MDYLFLFSPFPSKSAIINSLYIRGKMALSTKFYAGLGRFERDIKMTTLSNAGEDGIRLASVDSIASFTMFSDVFRPITD